jgi:hypothetical protein
MKYFLLAIVFLFSFETFAQGSLESDRLALVALYNATDGPNWIEQSGWNPASLPGTSPCGWYGVTCDGGRVTGLDLNNCLVNGNIPPEIGNLDQLKTLIVGWISLATNARGTYYTGPYGPIPTEIGNLTNLEYLDLSGNYAERSVATGPMPITGPLPASLGNLTKLTYLDLSFRGNDLQYQGFIDGSIPKELGNLVNLKYLNLSAQKLTGTIPVELGNLVNLEYLGLKGPICCDYGPANKLTGPIPDLSGIPVSASITIYDMAFTFDGLEANATTIDSYERQAYLPIYMQNGKLRVEAGGTIANNTYRWYKRLPIFGAPSVLEATIVGDNQFRPSDPGIYSVAVTNSVATKLRLVSKDYTITSMPVTLAEFLAKSSPEGNLLTWKTTSETDNSGFEIEKSVDARTFEKIGFVDGNGDTEEDKIYHFTDLQPHRITYYRLKQLDRYDGKFEYSKIIMVKQTGSEISIYPNPAQNQLTISGMQNSEYVSIFSQNGTLVSKQLTDAKGNVEMGNLANGMYTIKIGDKTKKIVIRR